MTIQLYRIIACVLSFTALTAFANDIEVRDAWARASIPGTTNGAAYASLLNNTERTVTITGLRSAVSDKTELHRHVHEDGMMKMEHVREKSLQPGETLTMKPGGHHIMLMGLKEPLKGGSIITIELLFGDGSAQSLQVDVREP